MDELQEYDKKYFVWKQPHEKRPTPCVFREATKKTIRSGAQLPNARIQSRNRTKGLQKPACHSQCWRSKNSEPLWRTHFVVPHKIKHILTRWSRVWRHWNLSKSAHRCSKQWSPESVELLSSERMGQVQRPDHRIWISSERNKLSTFSKTGKT